jgi:hypothetical protein
MRFGSFRERVVDSPSNIRVVEIARNAMSILGPMTHISFIDDSGLGWRNADVGNSCDIDIAKAQS